MGNLAAFKSKISQAGDLSGINIELIKESSTHLEVSPEMLGKALNYIEELLEKKEQDDA